MPEYPISSQNLTSVLLNEPSQINSRSFHFLLQHQLSTLPCNPQNLMVLLVPATLHLPSHLLKCPFSKYLFVLLRLCLFGFFCWGLLVGLFCLVRVWFFVCFSFFFFTFSYGEENQLVMYPPLFGLVSSFRTESFAGNFFSARSIYWLLTFSGTGWQVWYKIWMVANWLFQSKGKIC